MEIKDGIDIELGLDEPSAASVVNVKAGGEEWKGELEKAVSNVGKIAASLLQSLEDSEGQWTPLVYTLGWTRARTPA